MLPPAAHASDVIVVATTDIWLAGQPDGASVTGYFGSDTAPANSPVSVGAVGGTVYTFSITGYTPVSVDGVCFDSNADAGACCADEFSDSPGSANSISLAHLSAGALVGVFVAAGGPSGPTPPALDFSGSGIGTSFASLSPLLDQLFFIGEGLTGTGTGDVQQFVAPADATELYLAVADSVGASGNNSDSISVDVSETPEPSAFVLVSAGLLAVLALRRKSLGWSAT
jgi:hypothetical protein